MRFGVPMRASLSRVQPQCARRSMPTSPLPHPPAIATTPAAAGPTGDFAAVALDDAVKRAATKIVPRPAALQRERADAGAPLEKYGCGISDRAKRPCSQGTPLDSLHVW